MAQQQIAAVAIVFNDNAYGNVRRSQRHQFDEHVIASVLLNPDFVKLTRNSSAFRGTALPIQANCATRSATRSVTTSRP